jgi:hypothetical protein
LTLHIVTCDHFALVIATDRYLSDLLLTFLKNN